METERIIKKLKLTPCRTIQNPECSSATIKIYDRKLVELSEATDELEILVKANKSKKEGALKENKEEKLLEKVENVGVKVEYVPEPFLTTMALDDYNTWRIEKRSNCGRPPHPKGWGMLRAARPVTWGQMIKHLLTRFP